MSVGNKGANEESIVWVPVCCSQVMRHSVFGSAEGKSVAAALVCSACGRHILLQPQPPTSVQDLSGKVISLLATARSQKVANLGSDAALGGDDMGEETLA